MRHTSAVITLLFACVFCIRIQAQPSLTPVQDTLYDQQGNLYSGPLSITPTIRTGSINGVPVVMSAVQVRITSGVLNVLLVPNTTVTPGNSSYVFRYGNGGTKTCTFPPSVTPLHLASYCSDNPPSNPTPNIPLPWLSVGGYTDGYYCVQVTAGVVSLATTGCPGSGRGALLLSGLTNSQLANLTNGQLASLGN